MANRYRSPIHSLWITLMLALCVGLSLAQGAPGQATGLTVTQVSGGALLSWTAPSGAVDGYEIVRRRPYKGEATLMTLVENTGNTSTTYIDETATEVGVRYTYRVKAILNGVRGKRSNYDYVDIVSLEPTAIPTEPPTAIPTEPPTVIPTEAPTAIPTEAPTEIPTQPLKAVVKQAPTATATQQVESAPQLLVFTDDEGDDEPTAEPSRVADCSFSYEAGTMPGEASTLVMYYVFADRPVIKAIPSCFDRYLSLHTTSMDIMATTHTTTLDGCEVKFGAERMAKRSVRQLDGTLVSEDIKITYVYSPCVLGMFIYLDEYTGVFIVRDGDL